MFCWPCILIHLCNKTNLMHCSSSIYFLIQPLHVSGIFVAHHLEVYCLYTTIGMCCTFQLTVCWLANRQSTEKHEAYQLLYIYSVPPGDGLQICPKHVEAEWGNKLRINSASSWFFFTQLIWNMLPLSGITSRLPVSICWRGFSGSLKLHA